MQCNVEARYFVFLGDAQTNQCVDDFKDDECADAAKEDSDDDGFELGNELAANGHAFCEALAAKALGHKDAAK